MFFMIAKALTNLIILNFYNFLNVGIYKMLDLNPAISWKNVTTKISSIGRSYCFCDSVPGLGNNSQICLANITGVGFL